MDLTLANSSAHPYKLPSYIYSCQELRHLKLSKCIFKPPLMFVGFRNLSILHLKKVSFVVNTFENFPLLEYITFVTCVGVRHFHICSPKLRSFTAIDTQDVRWSSFMISPNLTVVYIALCRIRQYGQGERIDLVKLVGCLPAIVNLSLDGLFLKVSTATGSSMESVVSYLEAPDCLDQTLDKLQTVNMKFMGSGAELLLIKLLLAHSPSLKKVTIEQGGVIDAYQGFKVSRELMRFSRALPRAEIISLEPSQQIMRVMAIAGNGNCEAIKSAKADIISNLPRDIIANILKRMPIKYVVRTSMLSRKWRYNWSTIPELEFGQQFFENSDSVSIISKLLLLHSGPILKFVIQISSKISFTEREVIDINQWILFLSRNGLEELTFEYSPCSFREPKKLPYKLPSHLFSCLQLTHLKLCKCSLFPPVTFEGFPNLINLELYYVAREPDLCLAAGDGPKRLPAAFNCLKMLTLSGIDFRNSNGEISRAICLICSSPNLQELEISAYRNDHSAVSDPGIEFWEEKCTMGQLRTVKFTAVEGLTTELKFIKYILACSPLLEKVYVEREEVADASAGLMTGFMISKELMRFRRASPKAEVMYSDPSEAKLA
ncbi:hypothetical protein RJ640_017839 [Escallonia rubra]|uniref:F-box domain-containing protein n=1 Tax=Escallonia rubra TaxID=112253 RepID=A0AA88RD02_9ASTE|nr:hypothetical protein RJ640_017839 [Escallonia rubra]